MSILELLKQPVNKPYVVNQKPKELTLDSMQESMGMKELPKLPPGIKLEAPKVNLPQPTPKELRAPALIAGTLKEIPGTALDFAKTSIKTVINLAKDLPNQFKEGSELRTGFQKGLLGLSSSLDRFNQVFYSTFGDKVNAERSRISADSDAALLDAWRREGLQVEDTRSLAEKIQDPKWFYSSLGEAAPSVLASIGIGIPAAALGAPVALATALGVSTASGQVFGSAYQDAISQGVDEDQAKKVALYTTLGSGFLEAIPTFRAVEKFLGAGETNAIKQTFLKNIYSRIRSAFTQGTIEGGTESLQTVYENSWKATYNEHQNIFEGVGESALFGGILGGGTDIAVQGVNDTKQVVTDTLQMLDETSPANRNAGFIRNPFADGNDQNDILRKKISEVIKEVPEVRPASELPAKTQEVGSSLDGDVSSKKKGDDLIKELNTKGISIPVEIKKVVKGQDFSLSRVLIDDILSKDLDVKEFVDGYKGQGKEKINNPIIIGDWQGNKNAVMDGWHRLAALKKAGVKEVDAYVSTKSQVSSSVGKQTTETSLIEEAKKYRTVDEFINKDKSIYSDEKVVEAIKGTDASFQSENTLNESFRARKDWNTRALRGEKESDIYTKIQQSYGKAIADYASDSVKNQKSELVDIYNKARGVDPTLTKEQRFKKDVKAFVDNGRKIDIPASKQTDKPVSTRAANIAEKLAMADIEGLAAKIANKETLEKEFDEIQQQLGMLSELIEFMPGKQLIRFVSKKERQFMDLQDPARAKTESERIAIQQRNTKVMRAAENAFEGTKYYDRFDEEGVIREAIDEYVNLRDRINDLRSRAKTVRADRAAVRKGEILMEKVKSDRRARFRMFKEAFTLTDKEAAEIRNGRNIIDMSEDEFASFLAEGEQKAAEYEARRDARVQLEATIQYLELNKWENLQKAMKLPKINEMSTDQLVEFEKLLASFQKRDEFLSPKKLETIDRTDLTGVRTYREARLRLAQKLGMDPDKLNNLRVDEFDRFRWDTSLAERNEFYKLFVEGFNASILEGEMRFLELEDRTNELMARARRGSGFANKVAPTDDQIFAYLEASPEEKASIAKTMTKDQYLAAEFFRDSFANALKYEYEQQVFKKSRFEDSYITHIRRDFMETVKSELKDTKNPFKAFWTATKELVQSYTDEYAVLNILDAKTNQILPLEKFFKYAMARQDKVVPTKNVAKAFLAYMKVFETKRALDRVIPEIMAYVDVLTPREMTPKGLFKDDRLMSFVKEYLNNKKGRRSSWFGIVPGGKVDGTLRAMKGVLTMIDLGFNIVTQIASHGGAQAGVFTTIGTKRYFTGVGRNLKSFASRLPIIGKALDAKYKRILAKYENYTGTPPWKDVMSAKKGGPDKARAVMFYVFKSANVLANRIHLLSSLTPQELETETVSSKRLAELQTELGRWLPIERGESIIGSTSGGATITQYRKWAVVAARTAIKNLIITIKRLKKLDPKTLVSKEAMELFRIGVIASMVTLITMSLSQNEDPKDDTFIDRLIRKMLQDSMSLLSAMNPETWTRLPRMLDFMQQMLVAMVDIQKGAKYKMDGKDYEKGDMKGLVKLRRMFTPSIIRTVNDLLGESSDSTGGKGKLPKMKKLDIKLPKLDKKLPTLEKKLPKLPKLPRIN